MLIPCSVVTFTISAISCKEDTWVLRYVRFRRPKHQSGANFVCPTGKKDSVINLCSLLNTRQDKFSPRLPPANVINGKNKDKKLFYREFHMALMLKE